MACDNDIEDIEVLVHRSPKIMTFAADCDKHLVHVPDVAESTLSPPQNAGIRWSKLAAPGSNGFVGYGDATLRARRSSTSRKLRVNRWYNQTAWLMISGGKRWRR